MDETADPTTDQNTMDDNPDSIANAEPMKKAGHASLENLAANACGTIAELDKDSALNENPDLVGVIKAARAMLSGLVGMINTTGGSSYGQEYKAAVPEDGDTLAPEQMAELMSMINEKLGIDEADPISDDEEKELKSMDDEADSQSEKSDDEPTAEEEETDEEPDPKK